MGIGGIGGDIGRERKEAKINFMEEIQMDSKNINKLREEWAKEGNPHCDHPATDKERINGMDTGDVVCVICGAYVEAKSN